MNFIFKLIAFPISLIIGIMGFLIVLAFGKIWNKNDSFELNVIRVNREAQYVMLCEKWNDLYPIVRALIAGAIYWYLFIK